jgi:hypothetical protein
MNVRHVAPVSTNVRLKQLPRVIFTKLILKHVRIVALVRMFALLKLFIPNDGSSSKILDKSKKNPLLRIFLFKDINILAEIIRK